MNDNKYDKRKPQKSNTGVKGVSFDKIQGRYRANINFRGKIYYLGSYLTLESAAAARKKAEAINRENFLEEYEKLMQEYRKTHETKTKSEKLNKNNNTGVMGVHFNKERKKYIATIKIKGKLYYLGGYKTLEAAAIVRKKAEEMTQDKFLEQYEEFTRKTYSGVKGVNFNKKQNSYIARIKLQGKLYYLGSHKTIEEAANIRKKAEEIPHDNFLEQYEELMREYRKKHEINETNETQ